MTTGRIAARFAAAEERAQKILIPFITAGDPSLDTSLSLMRTLVDSGADIIELGVPFSDPMADGPAVQAASERALAAGTRLADVLSLVARFREHDADTPVVLMGYMNPVEQFGYAQFAAAAATAGVDGVLTVDLPPEEAADLVAELRRHALDTVFLLSPTSPDDRIEAVLKIVSGYVYYVSLKGVTGAANLDTDEVAARVRHIKSLSDIPVAVGFGIRDAEMARRVSRTADAVVVGSALVSLVGEHAGNNERLHTALRNIIGAMRQSMDAPV